MPITWLSQTSSRLALNLGNLRIVVLGIVPETDIDAKQLVANLFGVVDRVEHSAELDLPSAVDAAAGVLIARTPALAVGGHIETGRPAEIKPMMRVGRFELVGTLPAVSPRGRLEGDGRR